MWEYIGDGANWQGPTGIWTRIVEHLEFVAIAMGLSLALALPVAIVTGHTGRLGFLAVNVSNIGRAIPSLAFLALFATVLPRGFSSIWPTILALIALAVPPLVTNTYIGMRQADPDAVSAAVGVGMSPAQVALRVEVPLALPLIIAGLRTALTNVIATATLAALITQGGLGRLIVDGQAQANRPMQITGAVLVALMALIADGLLLVVAWWVGRRRGEPRRGRRRAAGAGARPIETGRREEGGMSADGGML